MADRTAPIASAVILPEPEVKQAESPRAIKRRHSSISDPTAKRPRLSTEASDDSPSTVRASPQASPLKKEQDPSTSQPLANDRRNSRVQEERKRGQRLFGGLLNTLSQSTSSSQQKRRQEIERRQQEKAKQQKAEDEERRSERLRKLKEVRQQEMVKFNEQSMRILHSSMLTMAHFLCTKTEPKIYYKPWQLLPSDEERIKLQIEETEALIDREVAEFKAQHSKQQQEPSLENTNVTEAAGESVESSAPLVSNVAESTNVPSPKVSQPSYNTADKDISDEIGEVVVVNEEDTVIY